MVKNPPAMQETGVLSLGQKDPLENGTATLSSILAWRIPWTEEPGGLQSLGSQRAEPLTHTHSCDRKESRGMMDGFPCLSPSIQRPPSVKW